MRANVRYVVLFALMSLFFMQIAVSAEGMSAATELEEHKIALSEKVVADVDSLPTEEHLNTLEIAFPDISGWNKSEVQKYPQESAGYSVTYQSRSGERITAYVYNGGESRIPDGVDSRVVKDELKNAEQGIYYIEERGVYSNVKKLRQDVVSLNGGNDGIKSLRSVFSFDIRGTEVTSEILIFGYKDHFIKFRATRPRNSSGNTDFLRTFWRTMNSLFSDGGMSAGAGDSDELEIAFPFIKGWRKGEIQRLQRKELGYIINYESDEGGRVTIYVYNPGVGNIPDGAGSRLVKEELKNAERGIYIFEERGIYENVKKIRENVISFNGRKRGVKSLLSVYNFSVRGNKVTSEIYLFGYKNHFIKFRATRKRNAGAKAMKTFYTEMNKLFSK